MQEDLERLYRTSDAGRSRIATALDKQEYVRTLPQELRRLGHQVSHQLVSELLHTLGYSLQAKRSSKNNFPSLILSIDLHYLCGFVVEDAQAVKKGMRLLQNQTVTSIFTSLAV